MNRNETSALSTPSPAEEGHLQEATGESALGAPGEHFTGDPALDPLAGAMASKRGSGGVILIIAVILTAVAGLFSMRRLAQVTAAAGIRPEIEATVENFLRSITGGPQGTATGVDPSDPGQNDHILAVITEQYSERQIPLKDVHRDPFMIASVDPEPVPTATPDDPEAERKRLEREREERRQARRNELQKDADRLRLKSIVGGSRPMALIDEAIVLVGDEITSKAGHAFRVTSIGRTSVSLAAEDAELGVTVNVTLYLDRNR